MKNSMNKQTAIKAVPAIAMQLVVAIAALGASAATAHSGAADAKSNDTASVSIDEYAFGRQGDPKQVTKTIAIDMADTMRFSPAEISVREGETIRFVVTNKGRMMHEMVIGTMEELKAHGALMKKHPGMEHEEPYMSHAGPGGKARMVWQFTKVGDFYYACLIPGHFEAGMIGKITVRKG